MNEAEKRETEMEGLLRSARAIAARRGENTAWDRFDASIAELRISPVTARTYRLLEGETVTGTSPHADHPPHQRRLLQEKTDLDDRLSRLDSFLLDNPLYLTLPEAEQKRLTQQARVMGSYSDILGQRIAAFPPEQK